MRPARRVALRAARRFAARSKRRATTASRLEDTGGSNSSPSYIEPQTELDRQIVHRFIGASTRTFWFVQSRCDRGKPSVLRVHPLNYSAKGCISYGQLNSGLEAPASAVGPVPFPTIFWLVCNYYRKAVSEVEAEGGVAQVNDALASDPLFMARHRASVAEYTKLRVESLSEHELSYVQARHTLWKRLGMGAGVGGTGKPDRVRCLHEHVAHYLATGRDAVGEYILREFDIGPPPAVCCCD